MNMHHLYFCGELRKLSKIWLKKCLIYSGDMAQPDYLNTLNIKNVYCLCTKTQNTDFQYNENSSIKMKS